MENVTIWMQNSLFINIIKFFLRPAVYQSSVLYKGICVSSDFISKAFRGSLFRAFFTNKSWENNAIKESRFMSAVLKLNKPIKKLSDMLNNTVENSIPVKFVSKSVKLFTQVPFATAAHILLPSAATVLILRAVFESYTPKALIYHIILLIMLFFALSVKVSLDSLLSSSIAYKSCKWFLDGQDSSGFTVKHSQTGDLSHQDKLHLAVIGVLAGILYYYLHKLTFIKLCGLVLMPALIYLWPWLGLALTALILPLAPTTYSVGIIGLTFLSVLLKNDKFKKSLPAAIIPSILFMISAGIAAAFSVARAESLKALPLYVAYFMIFYCASVLFRDSKTIKTVLAFLVISVMMISLLGIYQYFFVKVPTAEAWVDVKQFPELATRVYATLENPNVLGEYLGLAIPLLLGLFWASGKFRQKFLLTIVLGISTLCLVLTFSRGAWLGLAVAVLAFALIKEPKLLILLLILAILAPMFLPSVVTNRIASIGSLEDSSNAYRITIWIAALRMMKNYWLNGVGLGSTAFARVYRDYMIAGASAIHAHNLYLEVGLEMGILGLFALLWMAFRGFSEALIYVESNSKMSFVLAGIVAGLVGHLFHGLFDYVWYSPRIVMAFWMYFGMMSAIASGNLIDDMTGEKAA